MARTARSRVRGGMSFLRLSGVFFATRISAHYLRITYALPAHYSRIFCILSNAAECRLHPTAVGRVGVFATRIRAHFRAFTAHLRRTFCAFCTLSTDFG